MWKHTDKPKTICIPTRGGDIIKEMQHVVDIYIEMQNVMDIITNTTRGSQEPESLTWSKLAHIIICKYHTMGTIIAFLFQQ